MPPRLQRVAIGPLRAISRSIASQNQQICPICSFSRSFRRLGANIRTSKPQLQPRRIQVRRHTNHASTTGSNSSAEAPVKIPARPPRIELHEALSDLQKHAASYVNISRLQLALRGLDQPVGEETIRIAILGLADGGASLGKAKELARLLVADPLKVEEEWERILVSGQGSKPILLKIGQDDVEDNSHASRLVQQLQASSPMLNGHNLEILVLEMDPPRTSSTDQFTEAVLVPTMEILTSSTGRYTPVTTPIHKAVIVADGIMGAATVLNYPPDVDQSIIRTAVDLQIGEKQIKSPLPFRTIDSARVTAALNSFREDIANALVYEQNWFASNVPKILDWVRSGTSPIEGAMKPPLRKLIESLLQNATLSIEAERSRQLKAALAEKVPLSQISSLKDGLSTWANRAHTELRDELDIAFNGHRWRKLSWWKLFWRVDDVSMIASDILSQRFLTNAEKDLVFLAGRILESGILNDSENEFPKDWAYKRVYTRPPQPRLGHEPPAARLKDLKGTPDDETPVRATEGRGPLHISAARKYLSKETVPALQALAQKLVLQTLTTSGFTSIFAGLMYAGSVTTGLYEAGAFAALGIVWSMKRMQGRWEGARQYWEGEVREEGRKAVRSVEVDLGEIFVERDQEVPVDEELEKAGEAVERAEEALRDCK